VKEQMGDLWAYPAEYRVVPTNGTLDARGRLVMGAGVAREARRRFPGLPEVLGAWVARYGNRPFRLLNEGLLTFPTKFDWRDKASLELVRASAVLLAEMVDKWGIKSVAMPRVGCGLGGLSWGSVSPILSPVLADRFVVLNG
jgi:O-acetyl-ADP-ribose deacetylase (regulator of RNase III)